jgi:uncharacterized protein (TIGR02246 family)
MIARTLAAVVTLGIVGAVVIAAAPPGDEPTYSDEVAAIRKNTIGFQAAWNKHDPKALASFWAPDGDLIDPWGVTSSGSEAVEKFLASEHTGKGKLAHSTYDIRKDAVRLISGDVALEDWEVVLTGLSGADGKPLGPQFHRVFVVSKKVSGEWHIQAARPGLPTPEASAGGAKGK